MSDQCKLVYYGYFPSPQILKKKKKHVYSKRKRQNPLVTRLINIRYILNYILSSIELQDKIIDRKLVILYRNVPKVTYILWTSLISIRDMFFLN